MYNLKIRLGKWRVGNAYDSYDELRFYALDVLNVILFGHDADKVRQIRKPFIMPDNTAKQLDINEFFIAQLKSYYDCYLLPVTKLVPFVNHYDLINPFIRIKNNRETFKQILREAIAVITDKQSVLYQMLYVEKLDKEVVVEDLIAFFGAQSEPIPHAVTNAMYNLKKYPGVMRKLKAELEQHFAQFTDINDQYSKDNIMKLDYLNNVVKETIRIDPPAVESLRYKAFEDVKICDVHIPKHSLFVIDPLATNYNTEEWIEPFKFIPERFDSGSKYFLKPNSDKMRSPYSYSSFSYGARA